MRERRRALSPGERAKTSSVICQKLLDIGDIPDLVDPFEGGFPVAVYLASSEEIDLTEFIRKILDCGVKVVAPRWNGTCYDLAAVKGLGAEHLRQGPMGIMEPAEDEFVPPEQVEAWIVPGLAFTRDGARLGYGGGWYDRFLSAAPRSALTVGVAHSFQVVDSLPTEPHDIMLRHVVDDSLDDEL